jgi:hypothetical protein
VLLASISSIIQAKPDFKTLERSIYAAVAAQTCEQFTKLLEALDAELMVRRPVGLRHRGCKRRVVQTLCGPVSFQRRRYAEVLPTGERRWRYLLDETFGLPPETQASPGLVERAVSSALQLPYRQAASVVRAARPDGGGPSHGTIHRWVRRVGDQRLALEARKVHELFEEGVLPPTQGQTIETLFVEGDELRVALQGRRRQRRPGQLLPKRRAQRGEVRLAICHRGWSPRDPGSVEYRLVDKHIYAAVAEAEPFWRGAVLSVHEYCQLEQVRCTVLNGDGAAWIRHGMGYLPACAFQLDRWHLWQAMKQGLLWQPRQLDQLWRRVAEGAQWETIQPMLRRAFKAAPDADTGAAVRRLQIYLWDNRDGLQDYRVRSLPVAQDPSWRGLGAAEGNVDKPWAGRLTKRGMSWGAGLPGFVRLLNLQVNGTLTSWLEHSSHWRPIQPVLRDAAAVVHRVFPREDDESWLQVRMPALTGPSHWLRRMLKELSRVRLPL